MLRSVAHQPTGFDEIAQRIGGRIAWNAASWAN